MYTIISTFGKKCVLCAWTKAKTLRTKVQHCSKGGQLLYMSGHVYQFQEISVYFADVISCSVTCLLWIINIPIVSYSLSNAGATKLLLLLLNMLEYVYEFKVCHNESFMSFVLFEWNHWIILSQCSSRNKNTIISIVKVYTVCNHFHYADLHVTVTWVI